MTQEARMLALIFFAIAATITVDSTGRTLAQEAPQLGSASDEVLTSEFSAATKQNKVRHHAKSGKPRSAMWSRIHNRRSAKGSVSHNKTGLASKNVSKVNGTGGQDKGKMGMGPSKLANAPGKMGGGPGKLGAGPAGAGTNEKVFMDNMEPSNTTPSTQNAQDPQKKSPHAPRNPAAVKALNDLKAHTKAVSDAIRKRLGPNATDAEVRTATIKYINDRSSKAADKARRAADGELADIKAQELAALAKAQAAADALAAIKAKELYELNKAKYNTPEMIERRRLDNEDTNRRKAEQQAAEDEKNRNPNADVYRPSGITQGDHDDINKRSLPGTPNGTEDIK